MAGVVVCCVLLLLSGMQYMGKYQDVITHFAGSSSIPIHQSHQSNETSFSTTTLLSSLQANQTDITRTQKSNKIGIVVVSDKEFQARQEPLYKTHRAYAHKHGYEYHVLEPSPSCQQVLQDFFFIKHCTVREFLSQKQEDYTLFVLDGDVIVASPDVSLDRWKSQDTDVLLYERDWNFELTAGNYMVRNTLFGRHFLRTWEQFDYRARSITGFHSADNGAIHLAVLQILEIPFEEYEDCDRRYQLLKGRDVENLTEYYAFVACTRRVLGPNRQWELPQGGGSLTVVHRYHGFSVDYFVVDGRPSGGIPFYHGDKNPAAAIQRSKTATPWKSAEEQLLAINEKHWVVARNSPMNQVPRVDLTMCLHNFSCQPASMHGEPRRDYYMRHNHTRIFEYYSMFTESNS